MTTRELVIGILIGISVLLLFAVGFGILDPAPKGDFRPITIAIGFYVLAYGLLHFWKE